MKRIILLLCAIAIAGTLTGQGQHLVVGNSDYIGYPTNMPNHAFLLEGGPDHFYWISGGSNISLSHPMLGDVSVDYKNLFFIQYNEQGEPLTSGYIRGVSDAQKAFSFDGGLQILAGGGNDIDASGQIIPINEADYLEFLASYDRNCNLQYLQNIWNLPSSVYPNSNAAMDQRDGSIYVYGSTSYNSLDVDGFGSIGAGWPGDFFYVMKYNQDLQIKWVYTAGFNADTETAYFESSDLRVFTGRDGNVVITGTYYSDGVRPVFGSDILPYVDNGEGVFVVNLDTDGNQTWILDGTNQAVEYNSRIDNGFAMSNGDFLFSGSTSTGYFRLGEAEFIFDDGFGYQNQFVFRISPDGAHRWLKLLSARGIAFQQGKGTSGITQLKGSGSEEFKDFISHDAFLWKEDVLYMVGSYQSEVFTIAGKVLPTTYSEQFFVASIDPDDGSELWGYGFSSDNIELHGLDVDRTGNLSIMGTSSEKQDYNGLVQVTEPGTRTIFHLGLDHKGRLLWYNNAHLQNLNNNVYGSDIEVLKNGEIFASLMVTESEALDFGSQSLIADFSYSSWLVGLKATMKLSGEVKDALGNPIFPGYVRAYKTTPSRAYPVIDSVVLNDAGHYIFDELYPGEYTLQVVPDTTQNPDAIPTYLGNQIVWMDAQFNNFGPADLASDLHISVPMVPKLTTDDGSGTVSGNVSYENGLKSTQGRPVKKASVMLLKKTKKSTNAGDIVAYFETDDLGNYIFENVPDDDYILIVDIPGLPMIQTYDVTILGEQIVSGLDYYVGGEGINTSGGVGVKSIEMDLFIMFPNPGDGQIFMEFPSKGDYLVRVYGTDGRMVVSSRYESATGLRKLDISGQEQGIYLIRVDGPDGTSVLKYILK
ncbi:MAG: T9SS type A sorting domain-containing protein [Bacteroidales bacterium]|nr:T9SS type A sorting domain-containing protein [Bacteroidales bacterium]